MSFGDGFIDSSLYELDEELKKADELLSNASMLKPFEEIFDESLGRPGTPVGIYLRMMHRQKETLMRICALAKNSSFFGNSEQSRLGIEPKNAIFQKYWPLAHALRRFGHTTRKRKEVNL